MPEICETSEAFLPLDTDEMLWEWDVSADKFYLSRGAREALRLVDSPKTMAAFYKLVPLEVASELVLMRERVSTGGAGAAADFEYVCNGFWVTERVMALRRDENGRATRLMGFLNISNLRKHIGFQSDNETFLEAGVFIFDPETRELWLDGTSQRILGEDGGSTSRKHRSECVFPVHPSECGPFLRHYELLAGGILLGDSITDIVRMRVASGAYVPMLMRSTVTERDADGKALRIAGIMMPGYGEVVPTLQNWEKNDRLKRILGSMGNGQWTWDTRQDTVYFSPRYLDILGYPSDDDTWFAKHWRDYVHPDDLNKVTLAQLRVIVSGEHGDAYECTYRIRRADGGWAWVFDRGCVTWRDVDGRAGHMVGFITDITTAQAERDQLEDLVRHDSLTGLRSRAFCDLEIEHIERNDIRPISIISVDITGLKMINDYLGHAKGDELLTKAAGIMRSVLRRSDCVGRVGGDEFIVILPGCDGSKGEKVLYKLRNAFASYNVNNDALPVFAALGLASCADTTCTVEEVMQKADEHMYHDKKRHRAEAHGAIKTFICRTTGREVGSDDRLFDE